jgi:hypothetical protein
MGEEREGAPARAGTGVIALTIMGLMVSGCSTASLTKNIFGTTFQTSTSSSSVSGVNDADTDAADNNTPCPEVEVRTGASTLMIGGKPGAGQPSPLDVRYQGSIVRTARECHLNAGLLTVKVGVEGRIITGPAASGPATIDVPLRIAVVQEGINPKALLSKLDHIPVTVNNAVDRVTFTHVDPDIAFPLPRPASAIDSYVIYVGFDAAVPQPAKKKPRHRRHVRR